MSDIKVVKEIPRKQAIGVVEEIVNVLKPVSTKVEAVGSFRRQKAFLHDIEFVCIPKKEMTQVSLFEQKSQRSLAFLKSVQQWKRIKGDWMSGKYVQFLHASEIVVDIFFAEEINYGWIKLIRTGPKEYSKRVAGVMIKKAGYYSENGLIKRFPRGEIISVPEEINIYKLLKQKYLAPEIRC